MTYQIKLSEFGFPTKRLLRDQKMVMQKTNKTVWKKIDTQIVKFAKKGDNVEGILREKEENQTLGNINYVLEIEDGSHIKVFGTKVLEQKLNLIELGTKIKIVYLGEGKAKQGQNPVKLFDVFTEQKEI